MLDESDDARPMSFWPSVTDLFMTLFIVALVLLAALLYLTPPVSNATMEFVVEQLGGVDLPKISDPTNKMRRALDVPDIQKGASAGGVVTALGETADAVVTRLHEVSEAETLRKQLEEARAAVARLEKENQNQQEEIKNANDKPPIIKIAEGDAKETYRFDSGSAVLSDRFKAGLRQGGFATMAEEIQKRNRPGQPPTVDTLEIIGHTDGVALSRHGNLDFVLPWYLAGDNQALGKISAGSNNDLGLLRALAIKGAWLQFVAQHPQRALLQSVEVRCYSAGQTVPEGIEAGNALLRDPQTFMKPDQKARRIEIRLTKLRDETR